jgi:hypothetical protein
LRIYILSSGSTEVYMPRFVLLSGRYHHGKQKYGTRITVKPGEAFDTYTERQTQYCRKYPEMFQEVAGVLPVFKGKVVPITPSDKVPVVANMPEIPEVSDAEVQQEGIEEVETVTVDMEQLKKMNMRDLLMFARENGISVKGTKKDEIIKDIEAALSTEEELKDR